MEKIKNFFAETRAEFRHVNWPTRKEAIRLTGVVIGMSLLLAAFLGGADWFFGYVLRALVVGR
jgi:preprotein translocase subunit SecE